MKLKSAVTLLTKSCLCLIFSFDPFTFCHGACRNCTKYFYKILFQINRATTTLQKHVKDTIKMKRQFNIPLKHTGNLSPFRIFHQVSFNT